MKKQQPEWVVLYLLIGLIFYEMTLLAAAVLFLDIELTHAREEKEVMTFILGIVAGFLAGKKTE